MQDNKFWAFAWEGFLHLSGWRRMNTRAVIVYIIGNVVLSMVVGNDLGFIQMVDLLLAIYILSSQTFLTRMLYLGIYGYLMMSPRYLLCEIIGVGVESVLYALTKDDGGK